MPELRISTQILLEKVKPPYRIAEIGVLKGDNAERLAKLNVEFLFLIDPFVIFSEIDHQGMKNQDDWDNLLIQTRRRLMPYMDKIIFIIQKSVIASRIFPDEYFDYVYIDGSHFYEDVKQDLIAWYPKVKQGGIFAGHDYNFDSVKQAVDEFASERGLNVRGWREKDNEFLKDWLIEK